MSYNQYRVQCIPEASFGSAAPHDFFWFVVYHIIYIASIMMIDCSISIKIYQLTFIFIIYFTLFNIWKILDQAYIQICVLIYIQIQYGIFVITHSFRLRKHFIPLKTKKKMWCITLLMCTQNNQAHGKAHCNQQCHGTLHGMHAIAKIWRTIRNTLDHKTIFSILYHEQHKYNDNWVQTWLILAIIRFSCILQKK